MATTTSNSFHSMSFVSDAAAGAFAGAITKTTVAPIERVKILQQLRFALHQGLSCGTQESFCA
jgi:hypothetical protein